MSKWSLVTDLALWGIIILQWLTIRDLNKTIDNEKEWSKYWREAWLKERSRKMIDDTIKRSDAIKAVSKVDDYGDGIGFEVRSHCLVELELVPSADRPQGEWIRTGRTNIYGGIEVQCSNCGDKVMVQHLEDEWYCRHCGADMGMKGADDAD